jgi:choline dehydrogenase
LADQIRPITAVERARDLAAVARGQGLLGREITLGDGFPRVTKSRSGSAQPSSTRITRPARLGLEPPDGVVASELRVDEGLRVADASVRPTITRGNTYAPTVMIGERCAACIPVSGVTADQPEADVHEPSSLRRAAV